MFGRPNQESSRLNGFDKYISLGWSCFMVAITLRLGAILLTKSPRELIPISICWNYQAKINDLE
jgi:hypothetical protein